MKKKRTTSVPVDIEKRRYEYIPGSREKKPCVSRSCWGFFSREKRTENPSVSVSGVFFYSEEDAEAPAHERYIVVGTSSSIYMCV